MKYVNKDNGINDCLEVEPSYNITCNGAMGMVVTHELSDDKASPMMTLRFRDDCESVYFMTISQVKDICGVLIKLAEEHLPCA